MALCGLAPAFADVVGPVHGEVAGEQEDLLLVVAQPAGERVAGVVPGVPVAEPVVDPPEFTALDAYCEGTIAAVHADLDGDDTGAAGRLAAHMRHVADSCGASRRGCFMAKSTAELAAADPDVAKRAERMYGTYEDILVSCLEQAQRAGDLNREQDTRTLTALLLITVRGMDALGIAGRGVPFMRQVAEHCTPWPFSEREIHRRGRASLVDLMATVKAPGDGPGPGLAPACP